MSIGPRGPRLKTAPARIASNSSKRVTVERVDRSAKAKAAIYSSKEFLAWRARVIARAGGRCEAVEDGKRCRRQLPDHRVYADHRVELRDGGAPFDLANGQCLCASHHARKTAQARGTRMGRHF